MINEVSNRWKSTGKIEADPFFFFLLKYQAKFKIASISLFAGRGRTNLYTFAHLRALYIRASIKLRFLQN